MLNVTVRELIHMLQGRFLMRKFHFPLFTTVITVIIIFSRNVGRRLVDKLTDGWVDKSHN